MALLLRFRKSNALGSGAGVLSVLRRGTGGFLFRTNAAAKQRRGIGARRLVDIARARFHARRPGRGTWLAVSTSVQTLKFAGVEGLREAAKGADLVTTQLSPGRCHGTLLHADVAGLSLSAGSCQGHLRARGVMHPVKLTIGTLLACDGPISEWGCETIAGDMIVFPQNSEQEGYYNAQFDYVTISLSSEDLNRLTPQYEYIDDPGLWGRIGQYRASAETRAAVCEKLTSCRALVRHTGPSLSPHAQRMLREEIIDTFLGAMAEAVTRSPQLVILGDSTKIVARVEDYVMDRRDAVPGLAEICSNLGLSRGVLDRAFHDALGIGPKKYLRLMRLSAVRRALIETGPHPQDAVRIALEHGFSDFEHFSESYRQFFGELPTQTTWRRRRDRDVEVPAIEWKFLFK
jgi:AraC-like DNA-binding protein